jgi:hypothetical protein
VVTNVERFVQAVYSLILGVLTYGRAENVTLGFGTKDETLSVSLSANGLVQFVRALEDKTMRKEPLFETKFDFTFYVISHLI